MFPNRRVPKELIPDKTMTAAQVWRFAAMLKRYPGTTEFTIDEIRCAPGDTILWTIWGTEYQTKVVDDFDFDNARVKLTSETILFGRRTTGT